MKVNREFKEYQILDAGHGEKIETWKDVTVVRPDPQAIWPANSRWKDYDAYYKRSDKGGGYWTFYKKLKDYWVIKYKDLNFKIAPTNFKHMGLFPEQAVNWDYMIDKIKNAKNVKVLNLFAYTGGATIACSYAGADLVVHVDASKGMISWAKENMVLNHLENKTIRFIQDDCLKFIKREARRGHKYDVIIMDPPSYGRGSNGEVWKFENNINELVEACLDILSDKPLFFQINSYTTGISAVALENILRQSMKNKYKGYFSSDEVGLPIKDSDLILPCGIYARFESEKSN